MDMQKYLELFISEASEHITEAGRIIARLKEGIAAPDSFHALFRHFHSIKGMAASMSFGDIGAISHVVEDLCDALRKGRLAPRADLADRLLEATDMVATQIETARSRRSDPSGSTDHAALLETLRGCVPGVAAAMPGPAKLGQAQGPVVQDPAAQDPAPQSPDLQAPAVQGAAEQRLAAPAAERLLRCMVEIDPQADFAGPRAALVLRRLESLGRITRAEPPATALLSSSFDGHLTVEIATRHPGARVQQEIQSVMDVVSCDVSEATGAAAQLPAPAAALPATVRIPTATLDAFLEALAGLIGQRGALSEALRAGEAATARDALRGLTGSIDRLRDQVLEIRLLPFELIVPHLEQSLRALCRHTGKDVALHVEGSEVAMDRSVLEEIIDPLMHLLRNATDHGIETADRRTAAGKPARGTIHLKVAREAGQARVIVQDDGRGMDVEAIRRIAVAGRYVSREELARMDDAAVLMLTTIPGFSTAGKVTEISGRGVGMDVVRTRIEALGGHMAISSTSGAGARVDLVLPLSVAVIDAFLVECRAGVFAVPSGCVERVEMIGAERLSATGAGHFLRCGPAPGTAAGAPGTAAGADQFVPLVDLDAFLGTEDAAPRPSGDRRQVLHYTVDGAAAALSVHRVVQRAKLLVKPLGMPLERLRRYSGSALLDDGRVALILEVSSLRGQAA